MTECSIELCADTERLDLFGLLLAWDESLKLELLVAQAIQSLGELFDFLHAGGGGDIERSRIGAGFLQHVDGSK